MNGVEVAKRRRKVETLARDGIKHADIARMLNKSYGTIRTDIKTQNLQKVSLSIRKDTARKMRKEGMSCIQIAKKLGVSRASVYNYLKAGEKLNYTENPQIPVKSDGIAKMNISLPNLQKMSLSIRKDKAGRMRKEGMSCIQIAEKLGVSRASVYNYLKEES